MPELHCLDNESAKKVTELQYEVKIGELRDQLKVVNSENSSLSSKVTELEEKLEDNTLYIISLTKKVADLERKVEELEPGNANFLKRKVHDCLKYCLNVGLTCNICRG